MSISVILADDHPFILEGLQLRLDSEPGINVLACCQDGEAALQSVKQHQPDILLLDLSMPKMNGIAVLEALKQQGSAVKVVILTAGLSDKDIITAIQLGARGVVLKETAPQLLVQCIYSVYKGNDWLEVNLTATALGKLFKRESELQQINHVLTPSEIKIVKMVANGLSNKQVAERCFINQGTVKVHLHNIYQKLTIKNRVELALYAKEKGLV